MSHYPNHQWDYNAGPPNRRGHYPYSGPPQGWGPMGMPNPYYHNPHMVPAHAHAGTRINHWAPQSKYQQRAHPYSSHHPSGHDSPKSSKPLDSLSSPRSDPKAVTGLGREDQTVDLSSRLGETPVAASEKPVALTVDKASEKEISSTNETVTAVIDHSTTHQRDVKETEKSEFSSASDGEEDASLIASTEPSSEDTHSPKPDSREFTRASPTKLDSVQPKLDNLRTSPSKSDNSNQFPPTSAKSDNLHQFPRTSPAKSDNLHQFPRTSPSKSDNLHQFPRTSPAKLDNLLQFPRTSPGKSDNLHQFPCSTPAKFEQEQFPHASSAMLDKVQTPLNSDARVPPHGGFEMFFDSRGVSINEYEGTDSSSVSSGGTTKRTGEGTVESRNDDEVSQTEVNVKHSLPARDAPCDPPKPDAKDGLEDYSHPVCETIGNLPKSRMIPTTPPSSSAPVSVASSTPDPDASSSLVSSPTTVVSSPAVPSPTPAVTTVVSAARSSPPRSASMDPVASSTPVQFPRPGRSSPPPDDHRIPDGGLVEVARGEEPVVSQSGSNATEVKTEGVSTGDESAPKPSAEAAESLPTVSSTSADVKPSGSGSSKKKPAKRKGKSLKGKGQGPSKKPKVLKPVLKEKNEWKGPVLHVTGSRDSPLTVDVLNAPRNDDEEERRDKIPPRAHHHFDLRGKSRSGLFSSTLSSRYDAKTSDPTWVCVFCKCGPHRKGLGDLFGPYTVSKDMPNDSCDLGEFSGDEQDIVDAQKRGGRNKRSIRANNLVEHFTKMSRKLKRNQTCETAATMLGLIPMDNDPDTSEEGEVAMRYQVWTHEMCAVWSPGVCLVDTRLLGLQEAVWHCHQEKCSKCGKSGANLGCIHRNCPNRSHYACAVETGWHLPIETFISTCHFHVQRS